jgi:hypothetical protein
MEFCIMNLLHKEKMYTSITTIIHCVFSGQLEEKTAQNLEFRFSFLLHDSIPVHSALHVCELLAKNSDRFPTDSETWDFLLFPNLKMVLKEAV